MTNPEQTLRERLAFRVWDGRRMRPPSSNILISSYSGRAWWLYGYDEPQPMPDAVVMQFTGMEDSDGCEIYEGDIVEFTWWWFDGAERDTQLIGEIAWRKESMSFALVNIQNAEWVEHSGTEAAFSELNFSEADFRIIGNIYETPELRRLQDAAREAIGDKP